MGANDAALDCKQIERAGHDRNSYVQVNWAKVNWATFLVNLSQLKNTRDIGCCKNIRHLKQRKSGSQENILWLSNQELR